MPTENLRDFYIKAGLLDPDPVIEHSDTPSIDGEAARARLYAIDPDFAASRRLAPRGLPTSRALTPEEKQAIWDRAFEADPEDAANAYASIPSTENVKPKAPLTDAEKRQKRWDDAFEADPDAAANAFLATDKAPTPKEKKVLDSRADKPSKKATSKKAIPDKAGEATSSAKQAAPTKGFDQLLEGALAGDKNAIALVNSIGRLNGFDKIQVTKDGIQYQEGGEWKTASPEDLRPVFDQAVKGIGYWERLVKKFGGQPQRAGQAPRQAIPTDLDPAVLRSLRAKAILKGDVGDLVAYQRLPGQLNDAEASALYRRAAAQRALRDLQRGAVRDLKFEYLDDGSRLTLDKDTGERLELRDPKGRLAPISRVGQIDEYSKELDAMIAEAEKDGAELIPNGTDNPTVKLPGGRKVPWTQYQLAKEKAKNVPRGKGNLGTASTGEAK